MNVSGIVVTTRPAHVPALLATLNALPHTEVMRVDAEHGRLVVVQERDCIAAEFDGLRAIQRLANVIAADLVMHYFGDEPLAAAHDARVVAARLDSCVPPAAGAAAHAPPHDPPGGRDDEPFPS